jgi:polysaccharide export outer membrane protein
MILKTVVPIVLLRCIAAVLCAALLQLNVVAAQDKAPRRSEAPPETAPKSLSADMLIGTGDLLQVTVYGTDFDRQVRVSDSGEISLPLLGSVKVAGLSIRDGEQLVAKELARGGYFNDPQVSIFDREYSTQAISVLGEVQKPGIYPLPGARTLFDAISAAGGTTAKAGTTVTVTHRGRPDHPETLPLSYGADASQRSNVQVFPGDTVVVSKAGIVYVVGDVRQPSGIVMENSRMTVLQAIALAQGTNPTAAINGTKVIRNAPQGLKEIPVPLKKILAAKTPDVSLQPGDILFVPNSATRSAARRGLEAIVQTATGIAIYRP